LAGAGAGLLACRAAAAAGGGTGMKPGHTA
jgi:hypothetical protein